MYIYFPYLYHIILCLSPSPFSHLHIYMHVSYVLLGKRNVQSSRASAFDSVQASIHVGDTVNVVTGTHIKKSGTIKHIMKGQCMCECAYCVRVSVCMCECVALLVISALLLCLSFFLPYSSLSFPSSFLPSLYTFQSSNLIINLLGTLWLHSNTYLKNSGIFAVRARYCLVVGGKVMYSCLSSNPIAFSYLYILIYYTDFFFSPSILPYT